MSNPQSNVSFEINAPPSPAVPATPQTSWQRVLNYKCVIIIDVQFALLFPCNTWSSIVRGIIFCYFYYTQTI